MLVSMTALFRSEQTVQYDNFDGRNPGGWLYQIARRKVRDHLRSRWITTVLLEELPPSQSPLSTPRPDGAVETRQKREAVQELLGRLNQKEREVLILFELEGITGRGIAKKLGIPLNTVWGRLRTARGKMNRKLGELEPDWAASAKAAAND